jgi:hypothetical protein
MEVARHYADHYPEVPSYVFFARRKFQVLEIPVWMRRRRFGKSSITPIKSLYYLCNVAVNSIVERMGG